LGVVAVVETLETGTGGGGIDVTRVTSSDRDEPGAEVFTEAESVTDADAESFAFRAVFSAVWLSVVVAASCLWSLATFFSSLALALYTSRTRSSASSTSCTLIVRDASSSADRQNQHDY
jgi:hypothetical protein